MLELYEELKHGFEYYPPDSLMYESRPGQRFLARLPSILRQPPDMAKIRNWLPRGQAFRTETGDIILRRRRM